MVAFLVAAALLCGGSHSQHLDHTGQGACTGVDDDCNVAYTSLLQESASLLKQDGARYETGERPPVKQSTQPRLQDAKHPVALVGSAAATELAARDTMLFGVTVLASLVIFALVLYYYLVQPAVEVATIRHRHSAAEGLTMGKQRSFTASALEALVLDYSATTDMEVRNEDSLEEDTFCLGIALLVRDLQSLASGECNRPLRYSRLAFSLGLIFLTIVLQVSTLVCTKTLVTPQQVAGIRDAYDSYESAMYGEHTYVNVNGKHRGVPGFFNASAFEGLDDDLKKDICNIPLSQVGFISLVLLVWAITCMAQIKKCVENFLALICFLPTISNMVESLSEGEDRNEDDEIDDGITTYIIDGLTMQVKVLLSLFVFLPDFASTCYILWLGCRWLVATNDFGNVVSNAVALEFILMLKCLLYHALVSERNKRDLRHTAIAPCWINEPAGYSIYFSSTVWAVLAVGWVWYYVVFQRVLPDYKWDVHSVCTPWLQSQLDPGSGD